MNNERICLESYEQFKLNMDRALVLIDVSAKGVDMKYEEASRLVSKFEGKNTETNLGGDFKVEFSDEEVAVIRTILKKNTGILNDIKPYLYASVFTLMEKNKKCVN